MELGWKKVFAVILFATLAFSVFAVAKSNEGKGFLKLSLGNGDDDDDEREDERERKWNEHDEFDEQMPYMKVRKPFLHSLVIAGTQGIAVSPSDSNNVMVTKLAVGRVGFLFANGTDANASNYAADGNYELRCHSSGYCWWAKRTGVIHFYGKEKHERFLLHNVVYYNGTLTADIVNQTKRHCETVVSNSSASANGSVSNGSASVNTSASGTVTVTTCTPATQEKVGSVSLTLQELSGGQKVWSGKISVYGSEWNAYYAFKTHPKLMKIHSQAAIGTKLIAKIFGK